MLDRSGAALDQVGQFGQNPDDLETLLLLQSHQFIVHFEHGQRFHEDRCAARRTSMNNALESTFLLGPDWNDESAVADRDDLILKLICIRWTLHHRLKAIR